MSRKLSDNTTNATNYETEEAKGNPHIFQRVPAKIRCSCVLMEARGFGNRSEGRVGSFAFKGRLLLQAFTKLPTLPLTLFRG